MKYFITLLALLVFKIGFSQNITQTRTATLQNGDYSLKGTVHLEQFDNNILQLRFEEDYQTQSNVFDVHVFLSNTNNYTAPIDTSEMLLVENIGTESGINYSSGAMTFRLPVGVGINDYQYIVFVCVRYGQLHWGDGVFGSSTLSIPTNQDEFTNSVNLYPNPTKNGDLNLEIKDFEKNIQIEVIDTNGKKIIDKKIHSFKEYYSLKIKKSGLYFLKISSGVKSTVKKIIKI